MTGLFRTTVVEISGVRTIAGGGTNASNAGQALANLGGVSLTENQTIGGEITFSNTSTVFGAGNVGEIRISDGSYGDELGILTSNDEVIAIKYSDGSFRYGGGNPGSEPLVILNDIASFTERPNVNGTGVLLSGETKPINVAKFNSPYDIFTTGLITILSGLGPFERRVYSGSLGVLKNPNEAALVFAYTGRNPEQSINRFYATHVNSQFSLGLTHLEPLAIGTVAGATVTDHSTRAIAPGGVSAVVNFTNTYANLNTNTQLLFVTKDYLQATTNLFASAYYTFFSGTSETTVSSNPTFNQSQWPTGFSYIDRQNQFGNGFIVGMYGGPFTARQNPFGVQSANDSVNNQTGCSIMFEGAWLSDGPSGQTWLNMAFKNYGPSGINRVGGVANPTGLTLNVYVIN
jgi:hypothetical protein